MHADGVETAITEQKSGEWGTKWWDMEGTGNMGKGLVGWDGDSFHPRAGLWLTSGTKETITTCC